MPWPPPMQAVARPRFMPRRPQFERQRQQQARAGHPERMAERDGAAVDVDPLAIEAELLLDREVLRRERFVDLDEIDVRRASGRRVASTLRVAGAGPMPMSVGSTPTQAQCDSRAERLQPVSFDAPRATRESAPRRRRRCRWRCRPSRSRSC